MVERRTRTPAWQVAAVVLAPAVLAVVLLGVLAGVGRGPAPTAPDVRSAASTEGHRFWDVRADGTPVRWDPCAPIRWFHAPGGGPSYGAELVEEAVAIVERATGLDFVRVADRDERPAIDRSLLDADDPSAWAPVLVTWAPPHTGDVPLRTSDRAVSVPVSIDGVFVTGQIVLNADRDDLVPVMGDRATSWGATLVHELGHLVGLDHVDDPAQLMARFPGEGPAAFGDGDRTGLARLGADSGPCLDAGTPRDLRIDVTPRS